MHWKIIKNITIIAICDFSECSFRRTYQTHTGIAGLFVHVRMCLLLCVSVCSICKHGCVLLCVWIEESYISFIVLDMQLFFFYVDIYTYTSMNTIISYILCNISYHQICYLHNYCIAWKCQPGLHFSFRFILFRTPILTSSPFPSLSNNSLCPSLYLSFAFAPFSPPPPVSFTYRSLSLSALLRLSSTVAKSYSSPNKRSKLSIYSVTFNKNLSRCTSGHVTGTFIGRLLWTVPLVEIAWGLFFREKN